MDTSERIAAVVVTFNRKDMVQNCINGLLEQTVSVQEIVIVDNASTDGTEAMIKECFGNNKKITYLRLATNEGCTGGFHEGVKKVYDAGADWIWFLDDDIMPTPHCLENMLKYKTISKCIHPSKRYSDGTEFMWESVFDPATGSATFMNNISFHHGKAFTFVNIGCFEGMLIHRDVVAQIGLPDKRFFIAGDDTLYGFIASLYTNVIFVKDAMIQKLVPFNSKLSHTFFYYAVRNQFLIKEYLQKYHLYNKRRFTSHFLSFILYASIKQTIRNKNIKIPYYILRGWYDGARGKFYKLS